MGEPPQAYPQDVAIDYALLTPEPGGAVIMVLGSGLWAVARKKGKSSQRG